MKKKMTRNESRKLHTELRAASARGDHAECARICVILGYSYVTAAQLQSSGLPCE